MIDRQEQLTVETCGIYHAAGEETAHINRGNLIKNRRLIPKLRVARANAVKNIVEVAFPAKKEISIRCDVQRSEFSQVRNSDRRLPGDPAISVPAALAA